MITLEPIATVKSIFTENFGIPRQAGLCPASSAYLEFENNDFYREALKDLEGTSHLWIIFYFHALKKSPDKAKIRPPRLGGNKYVGVFSSRSPYRPNQIGLSLVEFSGIEIEQDYIKLKIANHDLLDGTPVLDIKPYLPGDQPSSEPTFGWQTNKWPELNVEFSDTTNEILEDNPTLKQVILDILKNNPAPAYASKQKSPRTYGMKIANRDVNFELIGNKCLVTKISP
ncbi:MAG: tRNA (N6-threonylcarbamoyladenosine(37)-N6)-methyltransferase TrmO [Lentisphaeraceae bacterium]|nr:tRNA (N6-threonylcarbamoyladenosine(37)-N6)-methyltransferase TrmO [Lentisphaeraceae bacterium]